jgi:uncharacterized membrane protein YfcA
MEGAVDAATLGLAAILTIAFLTEAAIGFGSTLIVVSVAALFVPLTTLLPTYQPLAVGLSLVVAWRERAHIDGAFLRRAVLPLMVPGLVVGMILFRVWRAEALLFLVGVAIAGLALVELRRLLWPAAIPVGGARTALLTGVVLVVAGVVHGLFGTSGPLVVWAASRTLEDKARFRATLSLLWLILGVTLIAGFVVDGTLTSSTLGHSAVLLPTMLLGYLIGDRVHHAVPQRAFRLGVCVLLVVAGVVLSTRALPAVLALGGG